MDDLPAPPPPIRLADPDGIEHELAFVCWRAPTGIVVDLVEAGVEPGEGFSFSVLGTHDADVDELVAAVRAIAAREVGRQYLGRSTLDGRLEVADDLVTGRFIWNPDGEPYHVVVDGKTLTWEELGRAFHSYEGWRFTVTVSDSVDVVVGGDSGPSAEVIAFPVAPVAVTEPAASAVKPSKSMPPADVEAALAWAHGRNEALPERAVGKIRYEVDIEGQAVTLFECRPPWRPELGTEWTRFPIVRFRYTKARREWATYWRDRNLKFHRYDPLLPARDLQDLIEAVEDDHSGIFWG